MVQYNLVSFPDGTAVVTAYIDGQIYTARSDQPGFDEIVEKLRSGDNGLDIAGDFDVANFANRKFHEVTDRVNVREGTVYLDDEPVHSAIAELIVNYMREGNTASALPLVRFLERLDGNPSHRSREQFYRFVEANGIHIDDEGYVILYKGVNPTDDEGVYQSVHSGRAVVNGEEQKGRIRTKVGDVVTMPRHQISDDPTVACHAGLHCGARSYASSFASVLITVRVDPADVVSVPVDSADCKVRVERYEIMDVVGDRQINTVRWTDEDDDGWLTDDYDEWGDGDY